MAQGRHQAAPQITSARTADIIAAIATPAGEGAVGLVRLSGPGCLDLAAAFLRWKRKPAPRFASLCDAYSGGQRLDQVLATFFEGPNSYTGEDMVEISCHGSPFILSRLLEQARRSGARLAEPGEFTRRAYVNGRMDLVQAEAVCGLIRARTHRAHRAAMEQLDGGLSRKLETTQNALIDLSARLGARLDHPEDDVPELGRTEWMQSLGRLRSGLEALLRTYRVGRLTMEGCRIAIVGRPNAGKSSLLNAFLGRDRALVSEIPGTTRDTLEETADLAGLKAVIIDTAGLRARSPDPVEQAGMERTRRALKCCDLALIVLDRSKTLDDEDRAFFEEIADRLSPSEIPAVLVLNKSDLPSKIEPRQLGPAAQWPRVEISAMREEGISALLETIKNTAGLQEGGSGDGVILTSLRHAQAVEECLEAVNLAMSADADELASVHVREALHAVGAVLGETTSDDVLIAVFSKFCIGK